MTLPCFHWGSCWRERERERWRRNEKERKITSQVLIFSSLVAAQRTTADELSTVFDTMVSNAGQWCSAHTGEQPRTCWQQSDTNWLVIKPLWHLMCLGAPWTLTAHFTHMVSLENRLELLRPIWKGFEFWNRTVFIIYNIWYQLNNSVNCNT